MVATSLFMDEYDSRYELHIFISTIVLIHQQHDYCIEYNSRAINFFCLVWPVEKFILRNVVEHSGEIDLNKKMTDKAWSSPESPPASLKSLNEEKHHRDLKMHHARTEEAPMEIGRHRREWRRKQETSSWSSESLISIPSSTKSSMISLMPILTRLKLK